MALEVLMLTAELKKQLVPGRRIFYLWALQKEQCSRKMLKKVIVLLVSLRKLQDALFLG